MFNRGPVIKGHGRECGATLNWHRAAVFLHEGKQTNPYQNEYKHPPSTETVYTCKQKQGEQNLHLLSEK